MKYEDLMAARKRHKKLRTIINGLWRDLRKAEKEYEIAEIKLRITSAQSESDEIAEMLRKSWEAGE